MTLEEVRSERNEAIDQLMDAVKVIVRLRKELADVRADFDALDEKYRLLLATLSQSSAGYSVDVDGLELLDNAGAVR